jgi:glyoxylase-like metal-dependent hydrolase (beta-lactamase superfamily II)
VRAEDGFVLIDTGKPERREGLEARLRHAGCAPGDLRLIVLTHGDYDHAGNAAYLRDAYGAGIAMHRSDAPRVETGDWRLGMKPKPDKFPLLYRAMSLLIRPGRFDTFSPNTLLEDGHDLASSGLDAIIVHLPGHTAGSIGVLTAEGDLFCGDLMDSMMGRPGLEFFIDDMTAARTSLARLRNLNVRMVYPGHGRAFRLEQVT